MPDTSGLDLKIERVTARVKAVRLARHMNVSRQRISTIESLAVVPEEAVAKYREALMSVTSEPKEAVA